MLRESFATAALALHGKRFAQRITRESAEGLSGSFLRPVEDMVDPFVKTPRRWVKRKTLTPLLSRNRTLRSPQTVCRSTAWLGCDSRAPDGGVRGCRTESSGPGSAGPRAAC